MAGSKSVESQAPANIAIFDLDYTLTRRGTWGQFIIRSVRFRPHLWFPLLIAAGLMQWLYKRGKRPRIAVKQAMMRWALVGKSKTDLLDMVDMFADDIVRKGLRSGAIETMERHREADDHIMIASAAVDIIVAAIAQKLGIMHWVATDMDWDKEDRLKPTFKSKNCYGMEKLARVKAFFETHSGMKQNHTLITMYSDSYSDLDILSFADVGVAVNPDRRLRACAPQLGFKIVDWD